MATIRNSNGIKEKKNHGETTTTNSIGKCIVQIIHGNCKKKQKKT